MNLRQDEEDWSISTQHVVFSQAVCLFEDQGIVFAVRSNTGNRCIYFACPGNMCRYTAPIILMTAIMLVDTLYRQEHTLSERGM